MSEGCRLIAAKNERRISFDRISKVMITFDVCAILESSFSAGLKNIDSAVAVAPSGVASWELGNKTSSRDNFLYDNFETILTQHRHNFEATPLRARQLFDIFDTQLRNNIYTTIIGWLSWNC